MQGQTSIHTWGTQNRHVVSLYISAVGCHHMITMVSHLHGDALSPFFQSTGRGRYFDLPALSAHLKKLCKDQHLGDALHHVNLMCQHGIHVPKHISLCLLQACIDNRDPSASKQAHSFVLFSGMESDGLVGSFLVRMFALTGSVFEASLVFISLLEPNVYAWSAMISAHAEDGYCRKAIELYWKMHDESVKPDEHTLVAVLKACTNAEVVKQGKLMHANIVENSFETNIFIGNTLIDMYAKCGDLESSHRVFDKSRKKEVVTWNSLITGYAQAGDWEVALRLFHTMQQEGIVPSTVSWNAIIAGHAKHGHGEEALRIFHQMQQEVTKPNHATFVKILEACSHGGAIVNGKTIHVLILENDIEFNVFVGSALINMYLQHGNLEDARTVFDRLPKQDVVAWSTMISGYAQRGQFEEAVQLFQRMQEDGLEPNNVTWNAMISSYAQHGYGKKALWCFEQMQKEGRKPNTVTFVSILKAYSDRVTLDEGRLVHAYIVECGFNEDVSVGSSLITMYANWGDLQDAHRVFDKVPKQQLVTWNKMIKGYAQHGFGQEALHLYQYLQQNGGNADDITFVSTLKACSILAVPNDGKIIHSQIIENGFESNPLIGNTLVDMYAKCGRLDDAYTMFTNLRNKETVSWNAMLSGYAQHDCSEKALKLFNQMLRDEVKPDSISYVSVLRACTTMTTLAQVNLIHNLIIDSGFECHVFIGSALIDMYSRYEDVESALRVFDCLPKRDMVTWSAMIASYAQCGHDLEAFQIYQKMQEDGSKPDTLVYVSILKACSNAASSCQGKIIHNHITEHGFESNTCVGNSLITMYAAFESLDDAHKVFGGLPQRDLLTWNALITACVQCGHFLDACEVALKMQNDGMMPNNVTWNTLISGYAKHGYHQEALQLYQEMLQSGVKPDNITLASSLKACSSMGFLNQGKHIHSYITASGMDTDSFVDNTLVNMYAKCGSFQDALKLFQKMPKQDVVAWNAIIGGYALHGDHRLAIQYFQYMRGQGLKPDDATFVCLLSACSHSGLMNEGFHHFNLMSQEYGMASAIEPFNNLIHLLGCAGHLDEAETLLRASPLLHNIVGWTSLLSNCKAHNNMEIARRCLDHAVKIDHRFASGYVFMASMYADADMWGAARRIQALKKVASAWKKPGKAFIQIEDKVRSFFVGDTFHPEMDDIHEKLKRLSVQRKSLLNAIL